MRIFIGTTEIAGIYRGLAVALRGLGHEVHFVTYDSHPFGYGGEDHGWLIDCIRSLRMRLSSPGPRSLPRACRRLFFGWLLKVCQCMLLVWATWRCEAFIFGFHQTILPRLSDLRWLRWWGRTVWMQSNGSDVRPPYIDASVCRRSPPVTLAAIHKATRRCRHRVLLAEKWATGSIDIPMQGLQRTKPFINWLKLGLIATPAWFPEKYTPPPPADNVRLLHCPSFPEGKGSNELRAIIHDLAQELAPSGIKVDYLELTGRPNADVLQALLTSDIVVDQLYADYGMAGFAVESAWFGRPVVVGGYAAPLWQRLLRADEIPPTHYVHPDQVSSELRRLILNPAERIASGRQHRRFMETTWAPDAVAARYIRLLCNDIPSDWWITVDEGLESHGWGFPEVLLAENVARYVQSCGIAALCLDHVPARERELFAQWTSPREGTGHEDSPLDVSLT